MLKDILHINIHRKYILIRYILNTLHLIHINIPLGNKKCIIKNRLSKALKDQSNYYKKLICEIQNKNINIVTMTGGKYIFIDCDYPQKKIYIIKNNKIINILIFKLTYYELTFFLASYFQISINLFNTLVIKTPSGGYHYYLKILNIDKNILYNKLQKNIVKITKKYSKNYKKYYIEYQVTLDIIVQPQSYIVGPFSYINNKISNNNKLGIYTIINNNTDYFINTINNQIYKLITKQFINIKKKNYSALSTIPEFQLQLTRYQKIFYIKKHILNQLKAYYLLLFFNCYLLYNQENDNLKITYQDIVNNNINTYVCKLISQLYNQKNNLYLIFKNLIILKVHYFNIKYDELLFYISAKLNIPLNLIRNTYRMHFDAESIVYIYFKHNTSYIQKTEHFINDQYCSIVIYNNLLLVDYKKIYRILIDNFTDKKIFILSKKIDIFLKNNENNIILYKNNENNIINFQNNLNIAKFIKYYFRIYLYMYSLYIYNIFNKKIQISLKFNSKYNVLLKKYNTNIEFIDLLPKQNIYKYHSNILMDNLSLSSYFVNNLLKKTNIIYRSSLDAQDTHNQNAIYVSNKNISISTLYAYLCKQNVTTYLRDKYIKNNNTDIKKDINNAVYRSTVKYLMLGYPKNIIWQLIKYEYSYIKFNKYIKKEEWNKQLLNIYKTVFYSSDSLKYWKVYLYLVNFLFNYIYKQKVNSSKKTRYKYDIYKYIQNDISVVTGLIISLLNNESKNSYRRISLLGLTTGCAVRRIMKLLDSVNYIKYVNICEKCNNGECKVNKLSHNKIIRYEPTEYLLNIVKEYNITQDDLSINPFLSHILFTQTTDKMTPFILGTEDIAVLKLRYNKERIKYRNKKANYNNIQNNISVTNNSYRSIVYNHKIKITSSDKFAIIKYLVHYYINLQKNIAIPNLYKEKIYKLVQKYPELSAIVKVHVSSKGILLNKYNIKCFLQKDPVFEILIHAYNELIAKYSNEEKIWIDDILKKYYNQRKSIYINNNFNKIDSFINEYKHDIDTYSCDLFEKRLNNQYQEFVNYNNDSIKNIIDNNVNSRNLLKDKIEYSKFKKQFDSKKREFIKIKESYNNVNLNNIYNDIINNNSESNYYTYNFRCYIIGFYKLIKFYSDKYIVILKNINIQKKYLLDLYTEYQKQNNDRYYNMSLSLIYSQYVYLQNIEQYFYKNLYYFNYLLEVLLTYIDKYINSKVYRYEYISCINFLNKIYEYLYKNCMKYLSNTMQAYINKLKDVDIILSICPIVYLYYKILYFDINYTYSLDHIKDIKHMVIDFDTFHKYISRRFLKDHLYNQYIHFCNNDQFDIKLIYKKCIESILYNKKITKFKDSFLLSVDSIFQFHTLNRHIDIIKLCQTPSLYIDEVSYVSYDNLNLNIKIINSFDNILHYKPVFISDIDFVTETYYRLLNCNSTLNQLNNIKDEKKQNIHIYKTRYNTIRNMQKYIAQEYNIRHNYVNKLLKDMRKYNKISFFEFCKYIITSKYIFYDLSSRDTFLYVNCTDSKMYSYSYKLRNCLIKIINLYFDFDLLFHSLYNDINKKRISNIPLHSRYNNLVRQAVDIFIKIYSYNYT